MSSVGAPPAALKRHVDEAAREERRRIAAFAATVRVSVLLVFLCIAVVLGLGFGRPDWLRQLPGFVAYAALSLAVFVVRRRSGFDVFAGIVALADVLFVYLMQRSTLDIVPNPAGTAGFSLGLFTFLLAINGFSLTRSWVAASALAAAVAQSSLMLLTDVGWDAVVSAWVVIAFFSAVTVTGTRRLRLLLYERVKESVSHDVERSRREEAEAARYTIETLLIETKAQNEQLAALERDKEMLTQLIVHDLRSPLTGLVGAVEVARTFADASGAGEVPHFLDQALRVARRLEGMINELLIIRRMEDGHLQTEIAPVALDAFLAELREEHAPLAVATKVKLEIAQAKGEARFDPKLVRRVLDNLVGNALRFAPLGGSVCIEARVGELLELWVHNDGPAIPEAARSEVFDRYVQAGPSEDRRRGFGLGLYFCRLVAEAHGGSIAVEEAPGWSCSFVLRLPRN